MAAIDIWPVRVTPHVGSEQATPRARATRPGSTLLARATLVLGFAAALALGLAPVVTDPPVLPASAPSTEFSGERAISDLRAIASTPHPMGSPEHETAVAYIVQQLSNLGPQPEVQTTSAAGPPQFYAHEPVAAGRVENILVRMPGTASTGAPTRPIMVVLLIAVYNLLVLALAVGVWVSPGRKRTLRLTAVMLGLFAILGAITGGIFNMDMRGAESTPRGALHPVMTAVMSIPIVLSLVFGAFLHGWRFGLLSLATLVAAAVGGMLTAQDVPFLEANLPTPWTGLKERINIYAYMLWVAALALSLWPRRGASSPREGNPTAIAGRAPR